MTVEELARAVGDACRTEALGHMVTGDFANSIYGILRSTQRRWRASRRFDQ